MPFLAAATVPPALAGLLLEGAVERRLGGPGATAAGLLAGSVALVLTDRAPQERLAVEAGGRGRPPPRARGGAAAPPRRVPPRGGPPAPPPPRVPPPPG